jgi:hypothetical protein
MQPIHEMNRCLILNRLVFMGKQTGDFLLLHFFWLLTFLLYPFTIQTLESVSPRLVTFFKGFIGLDLFFVFIAALLRFINFSTEKFISKLKGEDLAPFVLWEFLLPSAAFF